MPKPGGVIKSTLRFLSDLLCSSKLVALSYVNMLHYYTDRKYSETEEEYKVL